MSDICVDEDLWWLWCGNEANAQWIGPFPDKASADHNAVEESGCDHDHAVFRMTLAQAARHLPADAMLNDQMFPDAVLTGRGYVLWARCAHLAWQRLFGVTPYANDPVALRLRKLQELLDSRVPA